MDVNPQRFPVVELFISCIDIGVLLLQIILPELTLLKFSVTDDRGDLIGQRVLPLTMIRSGYRFIPLRDKHSQPLLMSSLFVFIKIENYVPEIMKGVVFIHCTMHHICTLNSWGDLIILQCTIDIQLSAKYN